MLQLGEKYLEEVEHNLRRNTSKRLSKKMLQLGEKYLKEVEHNLRRNTSKRLRTNNVKT